MTISLLFYSNFCQHCKQIVKEIKRSPVSNEIRYVCIDSSQVREKLPNYINSVPSLVVGETNQIFVGNQITGWLKMQPIISNNSHESNNEESIHQNRENYMNRNKPIVETKDQNESMGPNGWHNNEMNAFSDAYSFLGVDTSAKGNGGMSMVHNFETLDGTGRDALPAGMSPGGAPSNPSMPVQYGNPITDPVNSTSGYGSIQLSEKADILNQEMEEMMSRRELDCPNVPARI